MEQKNRRLIALAIALLVAGAMFTSFGRNLFALHPPRVILPDLGSAAGEQPGGSSQPASNPYQMVEVTPDTVQNVIRTLARPASFYREVTAETLWPGGSSAVTVQVWTDGGWTHSRQTLPSGAVRHDLVGEDTFYYWYEGDSQYRSAPADPLSADLSQRIPTYETVLALDQAGIRSAGYEQREAQLCILVEVEREEPRRTERYWIGVDSGLLEGAESEQNGQLVYRMTAAGLETPCPTGASFALPDGTRLHAVAG